jgi:predicted dehydrogenase
MNATTASRQLRVGLIGYGYAGRTFHVPLIDAIPGLALAAVASSRTEVVARELPKVRVYSDPADLIANADVDVVVVASPNDSHAQWARMAVDAGRSVVVEKPFALSVSEASELVELAAKRAVLLSVFQNRRWDSDYLTVSRAIKSGIIGRVAHFETHFDRFRPEVRLRWREMAGPGAGIWYDLGPHLVDQALLLFGLPSSVTADLATLREGGRADDWAHATLHYPDKRVVLHASMLVAGGSARFVVHGERGSLLKRSPDRQEEQLRAGLTPTHSEWGRDPDPLIVWNEVGQRREEPAERGDQSQYYRAIEAALRGVAANPTPGEQVIGSMAVIEACMEAARRGVTLRMQPRTWP